LWIAALFCTFGSAMKARMLVTIAVAAAVAAPLPSALAAHSPDIRALPKGDLIVIFSGSGGGSYRYHQPAQGRGAACRSADTGYTETDSYRWYYRFVLSPGGGSSDSPVAAAGGGALQGSEQLSQCAGTAALTSTCTQSLHAPSASNAGDVAYPGVVVGDGEGRTITIGAIGELVPSALQCSGLSVFAPNPVEGFSQLQASVSFDRAALEQSGDLTRRFTMAGSGLYDGVTLAASCNSSSCDSGDCSLDASPGGPPVSCSYAESYSGTIEIRVVR
jgi:hypothetical protein